VYWPGPGRPDTVTLATPTYDAAGELAGVTYGNGSTLDTVGRDGPGLLTGLTSTAPTATPRPWWPRGRRSRR